MEHRINYKKERQDREKLVKELKEHARKLEKIEKSFEKYSENIQNTVEQYLFYKRQNIVCIIRCGFGANLKM